MLAGKALNKTDDSGEVVVEDFYRSGSITLAKTNRDLGPSVKEQVDGNEMAPFEKAIRSANTMFVLHTLAGRSSDPYSRVWVRPIPIQHHILPC